MSVVMAMIAGLKPEVVTRCSLALCLVRTPSERTGTRDASRVTLFESEVER